MPTIYEDSEPIVFQTAAPVLFSCLMEKKMGLALQWKAWKPRVFEIRRDATLIYRKDRNTPIKAKINMTKVKITLLANNSENANSLVQKENGIVVACNTMEGLETYFRCVLNNDDLTSFYSAIRQVSKEHNLDNITRSSLTHHVNPKTKVTNQSVMRRTIATAMDAYDSRSKKDRIVSRRGAFKWMPVLFANDLVHGSWWFVVGSVSFAITSLMVLGNSFDESYLGSDDSVLSRWRFRSTWVLMTISGVFFTLGSLAFVRAVHEEPPMKPLFPSWYHIQNDELLGSWLFLLATIPIIPYSLIYLAASGDNVMWLAALGVAVIIVFGTYLFVRACYPQDDNKPRRKFIQPIALCMCWCFCSERWLKQHIANDWLAGTWFMYWGMVACSLVCMLLLGIEIYANSSLLIFVLATGLFENICFLIGSAYFVSGSYADTEDCGEDSDEESANSSGSHNLSKKAKNLSDELKAPFIENNENF